MEIAVLDLCDLTLVELVDYPAQESVQNFYARLLRMSRLPMVDGKPATLEQLLSSPELFETAHANLALVLDQQTLANLILPLALTRGRIYMAALASVRESDIVPLRMEQQEVVITMDQATRALREAIHEETRAAGGMEQLLSAVPIDMFSDEADQRDAENFASLIHDVRQIEGVLRTIRTPSVLAQLTDQMETLEIESRKIGERLLRASLIAINSRVAAKAEIENKIKARYEELRTQLAHITQAQKQLVVLKTFYNRCREQKRIDLFAALFATSPTVLHTFLNSPHTVQSKIMSNFDLVATIFGDPAISSRLFASTLIPNLIFSRDAGMISKFFARDRAEVIAFFDQINAQSHSALGMVGDKFKELWRA